MAKKRTMWKKRVLPMGNQNTNGTVKPPVHVTYLTPMGGAVTYTAPGANPTYTPPKRKRRNRSGPKKEAPFPQFIVENGWHLKKWIRLDDITSRGDRRVWRSAKFVTDDLFMTRPKHKHGPCLYHICNTFGKWIFYCRVPRGFEHCGECDKPIDTGILMIQNLQKFKR